MSIDKYAVLVRKNTILSGGLVDNKTLETETELIIPFDKMSLKTSDTESDPNNLVILTEGKTIETINELKNTIFETIYTATLTNGETLLPTADELNAVYNFDNTVDPTDQRYLEVLDLDGNTVYITANPNTDTNYQPQKTMNSGEGILIIVESNGIFEEAGFTNDQFVIDTTKNTLPAEIAGLDVRILANKDSIDNLDSKEVVLSGTNTTLKDVTSPLVTEDLLGDYTTSANQETRDNDQDIQINSKLPSTGSADSRFSSDNNGVRIIENRDNADRVEQIAKDNAGTITTLDGKKQNVNIIPHSGAEFPNSNTVYGAITDHSNQIIKNTEKDVEQDGRLDAIDGTTGKLQELKEDKQNKDASTNTSSFASTNMEDRDKEVLDKAVTAEAKADQAIAAVKGITASGELATYVIAADSEYDVPTGNVFGKVPFSRIQTNDGNTFNDGTSDAVKITSSLSTTVPVDGTVIIDNIKYADRKWIINSRMILRKSGNAGTNNPEINLMIQAGTETPIVNENFKLNNLDDDNDLHSFSISDKIINGSDSEFVGKEIRVWLEINPQAGSGISISQVRTFGISEKVKGTASANIKTDIVETVDSAAEGGGTQNAINALNKEVKDRTSGVTREGTGNTGATLVDAVNVKELHDRLSGYTLSGNDAVIDTLPIVKTFKKLLDVKVEQPDGEGSIILGDLLAGGKFSLTSLKNGQSLIDRTKLKLKQIYVEDDEVGDVQKYYARLFDEINAGEAFVDGFLSDFNINWTVSKVDYVQGTTDGVQEWNSIRVNNNFTIDHLKKTLTKPSDDSDLTLVNTSTLHTYKTVGVNGDPVPLTTVFNEIVDRVKNIDQDLIELNKGHFDIDGDGTHEVEIFNALGEVTVLNKNVEVDTDEQTSLDAFVTLVNAGFDGTGSTASNAITNPTNDSPDDDDDFLVNEINRFGGGLDE